MRRRSSLFLFATIALHAVLAATALGCPVCDTGTGQDVRDGLFDENFARNVFAVALPFPILLGVVAMIHFGWPARRGGRQADPAKPATDTP